MAKNTVTLALNGEVSLEDFAKAIGEFLRLIKSLGTDVAKDVPIDWWIDSLEVGSTIATARGVSETETGTSAVEEVVRAYEKVGKALQRGEQAGFSEAVQSSACAIINLISGRIRSVRFETDEMDAEISNPIAPLEEARPKLSETSYGAVQGRVQNLSNQGHLRFTLYRTLDDRPVSCYLEPGSEDLMRKAWGKLAIVQGLVRRDPKTGQPTTVRQVKKVEILPEGKPGSWRDAFGVARGCLDGMSPEEAIRKIRDA